MKTNLEKARNLSETISDIKEIKPVYEGLASFKCWTSPLPDLKDTATLMKELKKITGCSSWKEGNLIVPSVNTLTPFCSICAHYKVFSDIKDDSFLDASSFLDCNVARLCFEPQDFSVFFKGYVSF